MGNLSAYNTSTFSGSFDRGNINVAISSSIVSGSTGNIRFGDTPNPPSGGMVIISDSNTQLGIASASATPQFWIIDNLNDTASVLNTINALPERINQTRFVTTSSAYLYLVSSSKYFPILGTEPLNTPTTNGLTMYLDANQLVSYPTTASTWYDMSGNNNSGSLINGPTFNSNGAIVFDGVDDYTNTALMVPSPSTTPTTFNVVFSAPLGQSYKAIIGRSQWQAYGFSVGFKGGAGSITASSSSIGYEPAFVYDSTLVSMGTFVFDGRSVLIYKNGQLVTTLTIPFDIIAPPFPVLIANNGQGGWTYLNCTIYSAQAYNRALTQAEILQNYYQAPIVTSGLVFAADAGNTVSYQSGSTTTYSLTGSLSGSLVNGVGYLPNNGGTWDFDGTDDYLNFSTPSALNFTSLNAFSTEAWINWDGGAQPNNAGHIIGKTYGNYRTFLLTNTNPGTITFRLGLNTLTCDTPSIISANTWYHVVSTFNPSTFTSKVYVNGIERASNTNVNISWSSTSGNFQIGNSPGENYYFNGKITNGRVYNKTLTPEEVSQNFNAQRQRFGV